RAGWSGSSTPATRSPYTSAARYRKSETCSGNSMPARYARTRRMDHHSPRPASRARRSGHPDLSHLPGRRDIEELEIIEDRPIEPTLFIRFALPGKNDVLDAVRRL